MVLIEQARTHPVRHFSREVVSPPGIPGRILDYDSSREAIVRATESGIMTIGSMHLLEGLLEEGGVAQFPGGMGLSYDRVYKHTFETRKAKPAIEDMAAQAQGRADLIIAPEHSAIIPATLAAYALDLPILKIRKNGSAESSIAVSIESYTGGKPDILSVSPTQVEKLKRESQGLEKDMDVWIIDEILDTGAMSEALAYLVTLMRSAGIRANLQGVMSLMEKKYTGARDKIENGLGVQVVSGLQIDDLGIEENTMWMKVPGIPEALSFASS